MKIVNLNIWCARNKEELEVYIKSQRESTDIFCFQEATKKDVNKIIVHGYYSSCTEFLNEWLPEFKSIFASNSSEFIWDGHHFDTDFGPAIYSRLPIINSGSEVVLVEDNADGFRRERHLVWVEVMHNDETITVISYHGYWNRTKDDCPERIDQSNTLRAFLDNLKTPFVLTGDMNFAPHTKSLEILKGADRELVTEFGIETTRGPDYTREEKHADYAVLSKSFKLKSFNVPVTRASDHLPLEVDLE